MDNFEKAYYEERFKNAYYKAKGNTFQTFFNELMCRAYKEDFMPCRPWGNFGDRKNDGFLKSQRILFQVYAPNELTACETLHKIAEDFEGAKAHWNAYFDKWVFVHNAHDGIPPHVQEKLLNLEKVNPGIKLSLWGEEELLDIFRLLKHEDKQSWFGPAPTNETKANLRYEDIRVVLEFIATNKPTLDTPIKPVPPKKIEANLLSENIAFLLKHGMEKASLVDRFLSQWYDPLFGERTAEDFRKKYASIRQTMTPSEIFYEFQDWIGGEERGTAEHEMAILAVIAYYFETCDIFETPGINKWYYLQNTSHRKEHY